MGSSQRGNRYVPFRFSGGFNAGYSHEWWGVEDLAYLRENWILDWRRKRKRPWKGTEEQARELADRLNRVHPDVDFVAKGELSETQIRYYANRKKMVKDTSKRTIPSNISAFKKCHCGARYKGEVHCAV